MRIAALVEASTVTGAVKALIGFARTLQSGARSGAATVHALAFRREPHVGENAFSRAATAAGIQVTPVVERRAFDTSILPAIRRHLAALKPDVVQSHSTKSHFLVRLLRCDKVYPWMAFHHGYTRIDGRNVLYNQLDRWSLRGAPTVVTDAAAFVPELVHRGVSRDRVHVVHNPVEPFRAPAEGAVDSVRARFGITREELVILSAGRLSKEKGHVDLIDALGALQRRAGLPPFRLLLAGDGPERDALAKRARTLGIERQVLLTGYQPDMPPFYALADLFVLPSHSEGSPNVLLEALAAGVPVIATRAGGIPEIVSHGEHAHIAEPRNPRALAEAIASALTDDTLRTKLATAGLNRSKAFSTVAYTETLLSLCRAATIRTPFPAA